MFLTVQGKQWQNKYKERLRLYKRWPCSTYILNRVN